jgi:hypothetical protein
VDAPIVLAVDGRFPGGVPGDDCPVDPDPDRPGNTAACGLITAQAGDDVLTPISGTEVVLDAAASTADACVSGHLEYQWDIGGRVIQPFSTVSSLTDTPLLITAYNVVVRCSTDNECLGSDQVLVVPDDQIEASGVPEQLLELDLPAGNMVRIVATEPASASLCDLWIMGAHLSGGGGQELRQATAGSSAANLALALRARTCTDGAMNRIDGSGKFEFGSAGALAVNDIQGYMATALCGGIIGSLGHVEEGGQGIQGSRARLNPNSTGSCIREAAVLTASPLPSGTHPVGNP